jgi:hypothetical protein
MSETTRQSLGRLGETLVTTWCACPKCKRCRTLRRLPRNFKCADVICDFCGYLAQVKASKTAEVTRVPVRLLGAAWKPQQERMEAGIYFSLFLVLVNGKERAIHFLPGELQRNDMFICRKPLGQNARRAGWQGFYYDLRKVARSFTQVWPELGA